MAARSMAKKHSIGGNMKYLLLIVSVLVLPLLVTAQMTEAEKKAWLDSFNKHEQRPSKTGSKEPPVPNSQEKNFVKTSTGNILEPASYGYEGILWNTSISEVSQEIIGSGATFQELSGFIGPIERTGVNEVLYHKWGAPISFCMPLGSNTPEYCLSDSGFLESAFATYMKIANGEEEFYVFYQSRFFAHWIRLESKYHAEYYEKLRTKYGQPRKFENNFSNCITTTYLWRNDRKTIILAHEVDDLGIPEDYLMYYSNDIEKDIIHRVQEFLTKQKNKDSDKKEKALKKIE